MIVRQWYAQLDVFDAVRRYTALLAHWYGDAPTRERLFVSDFYLANPSLLHLTKMTAEARKVFAGLHIPKPEQVFVQLPFPAVLYNKMSGIQNEALHNMLGRGLCDINVADAGHFQLSPQGKEFAHRLNDKLVLPQELEVITFLTTEFQQVGIEKGGLRAATGLMRIGA